MHKSWQRHLRNKFRELQRSLPELAGGTRLVGGGHYGLVVEHSDGTVSKIFRRPDNPYDLEFFLHSVYAETHALNLFGQHSIQDIDLPSLIGEPDTLYHADYIAHYRMTRVSGDGAKYDFSKTTYMQTLYQSAGNLLGRFHKAASDVPFTNLPPRHFQYDCAIFEVPTLPHETNKALRIANDYLHANKKGGVIHGDYHFGNILTQDGIATGLLDFSFTCLSKNIYIDFVRMGLDDPFLPYLIDGYEQATREAVDTYLLHATELSFWSHMLRYGGGPSDYQPENDLTAILQINKCLNELVPITGYKP